MQPRIAHRNRTVRIDQTPLIENGLEETFLSADIASGSGTLTVKNISGLSTSQFLIINPYSETAEIVTTHSSTPPSGSTVTLAANTVFAHSAGEKVYRIEFNQVEISHASTLSGSKSVLSTEALHADQRELIYLDTAQSSGFYFARFKNSVASTFGSYSDGIEYGGWDENTVGYMIERALEDLDMELSKKITLKKCYGWITDGLDDLKSKIRRWPEHISYEAVLGQTTRGINLVTMPSDAYDTETRRSLLRAHIGDNKDLHIVDPFTFKAQMGEVKRTQVRTEATSGGTSLEIDNSYDFADSGSVHVYISGTQHTITYTGVTRSSSAGVLTGIPASGDGSISVTIPVDTYVWQDEEEGIPTWATVRNGNLEFWPLADASEDNKNIYGDYAKVVTAVNSQGDTIDYQRFKPVQFYLMWRMECAARKNGSLDESLGTFSRYRTALNDAIRTLPPIASKSRPRINRMLKRGTMRPSLQNIPIEDQ